jgi:serine/threonine protein kinase
MASDESNEKEEDFFDNMRDTLRNYCSLTVDDISENDLLMAYPIQTELKQLSKRYKDPTLIGHGGMKEIFKVTDLKASQSLAMAKLKKEAGRESTESFLREARLTACLQHPNIISIYDLGFDENESPYFTMELLTGKNLHTIINNKSLTHAQLVEVFNKVCDAVAYAHSRQIIHLDLKPDNIQVGEYGEVHLCDWGLAKILTDDDDMDIDDDLDPNILNHATINGRIKGSPGYMAPEQAIAYGDKDIRSDLYSMGAILYTIFTGQSPIQGKTIDTLLEKTKEAQIIPIVNFPNIPQSIQAIITKSLSKEKKDRYQSIQELKTDLDKYLHGFATTAEDAGFLKQLQLLILRNKKALAVIFLILTFISVTLYTSFQRVKNERELAISAKNEAITQKNVAESNFKLFREEQKLTENLRYEMSQLFNEITDSEDLSSAKRKISLLSEGLKHETKKKKIDAMHKKMALLHFVIQQFHEAKNSFDQCKNIQNYQRIYNACNWGINKLEGRQKLNDTEIAQLLALISVPSNFDLIKAFYAKHITFYRQKNTRPEEYLPLAKLMLNVTNNMWDKDKHKDLPYFKAGVLKLNNQPYHTFKLAPYDLNILEPLHIHTLDISHTGFFEFHQLHFLKLDKLNLAGCKINTFSQQRVTILKDIGVKKLTYDSRYLSSEEVLLMKANFDSTDLAEK